MLWFSVYWDMQKLQDIVGALKFHLEVAPQLNEALGDLLTHVGRMEDALRFYANAHNYIEGVPLHPDKDGLLSKEDIGQQARYALGLEDYVLGRVVLVPAKAGA
jgi:hypothetical protein